VLNHKVIILQRDYQPSLLFKYARGPTPRYPYPHADRYFTTRENRKIKVPNIEHRSQKMSCPRTIFLKEGLPVFEDHSSDEGLQWVTIKICDSQEVLFDAVLVDLLIENLQLGNYILTDRPMHEEDRLWVSFPML
jgi:hypothetical protein